mmetsp:Transcript_33617/g.81290  ORF Transcript_33617/g.81290 Transcript_33617/m.81290 type:complete len:97 (-) Transcript_33617:250-540(-)
MSWGIRFVHQGIFWCIRITEVTILMWNITFGGLKKTMSDREAYWKTRIGAGWSTYSHRKNMANGKVTPHGICSLIHRNDFSRIKLGDKNTHNLSFT